jgi:hypothetical protein
LGEVDVWISYRTAKAYRAALLAVARSRGVRFSKFMRMRDKEYLQELYNNRNQLLYNRELFDGLVSRFILLCRQDIVRQDLVGIATGAPGTQEKRQELQEVTWKAIAQAVEYSKSEEAAQNAVARLLALRVVGYLVRTGLAIQDSMDKNFIDDLVEKLEESHGEWATQTKASDAKTSSE